MRDIEQLLEDLTPPQRHAATHVDGPLLIIAGAGSGKTRVITRRVAFLLAQGVPAHAILAITFTNKAAGEMKSRVAAVIDRPLRDFGQLDQPWPLICTFHSLCLRILKHYAGHIGLPNNFSIFDTSDQNKLIKEAIKMLDIDLANFQPSTVHATISNAKNQLRTSDDFARTAGSFYDKIVARVYTKYQQLLNQNNALDFDDLILRAVRAFRDHPDVLSELQKRFQYILIDEYQDTNHAQYLLAHLLAHRHKNICVVGDPDQSIYAWRGADIKNILDFEKDYPDAKVVRLEQNYRSTKRILRIASKLIAKNSQRKDKTLWTENDEGDKAQFYLCQDEKDEASIITSQLKALHDRGGYDWNKMAIFYRMNALSRVMEDGLRKAALPYQIARGVEFYNRKEIKDSLAYLRIVSNPSDELSLDRVANVPTRGLSDATLKTMATFAAVNGVSLWEAMRRAASVPGVSTRAASAATQFVAMVSRWRKTVYGADHSPKTSAAGALTGGIAAGATAGEGTGATPVGSALRTASPANVPSTPPAEKISDDATLFGPIDEDPFGPSDQAMLDAVDSEEYESSDSDDAAPAEASTVAVPRIPVRSIVEMVIQQSGLENYLRKIGGEELDELENVNELISSAADFDEENPQGSLDDFLAQISLVSDADHMQGAGGAITLMTLHAAKGLEFPVVAIIGLEEGILPHSRARENADDREEERRLFFVGITRAQERLIISKAAKRTIRGISERTIASPFLYEIPLEDVNTIDRTGIDSFALQQRSGTWPQSTRAGGSSKIEAAEDSYQRPTTSQYSHLRPGQTVRHPKYGIGRIREIDETSEQRTRAVVQFTQAGQKTFYLEYNVQLEVIE